MSEWIKAIVLGLVEGITEWLPISSTGHLILLNEFIRLDVSEEFYRMFEVVIQLGAILAVVVLFWKEIFPFVLSRTEGLRIRRDICTLWAKIVLACIPAGVIGVLFQDEFERLFYNSSSVALALIVFGAAFLVIEEKHKGKRGEGKFACGAAMGYGADDRCISAYRGGFSGNFALGGDDCRRSAYGCIADDGGGIYVLSCHSGDVWGEFVKASVFWLFLYRFGTDSTDAGHGNGVYFLCSGYPFSSGFY